MLTEAAQGLHTAIAVIKSTLANSKQLSVSQANQPSYSFSFTSHSLSQHTPSNQKEHFNTLSIEVLLGGGCIEMALASRLYSEYRSSSDNIAANIFVKALEGKIS